MDVKIQEDPRTSLTIEEFMRDSMDITEWMFEAHQPFLGYISKGVHDKYIKPHVGKNNGTVDGRLYDIAWMSSCQLVWGTTPDEVKAQITINRAVKFPFGVRIGGRIVNLWKIYNDTDFRGGWVACLIMLPEEAARYECSVPARQGEPR